MGSCGVFSEQTLPTLRKAEKAFHKVVKGVDKMADAQPSSDDNHSDDDGGDGC